MQNFCFISKTENFLVRHVRRPHVFTAQSYQHHTNHNVWKAFLGRFLSSKNNHLRNILFCVFKHHGQTLWNYDTVKYREVLSNIFRFFFATLVRTASDYLSIRCSIIGKIRRDEYVQRDSINENPQENNYL